VWPGPARCVDGFARRRPRPDVSVEDGLAERLAQLAALIAELAETVTAAPPSPAVEVPVLLDIDEAARLLNVSRAKLYEGPIKHGDLVTVFIGSRRLVPRTVLDAYVAQLIERAS